MIGWVVLWLRLGGAFRTGELRAASLQLAEELADLRTSRA